MLNLSQGSCTYQTTHHQLIVSSLQHGAKEKRNTPSRQKK